MSKHSPNAAALAALAEVRFFSRIMFEHAKFIRGGLDPTREQEAFIRRADRFARGFGRLEEAADENSCKTGRIRGLVEESLKLTAALRDFQSELACLIEACRATAILPAALIVHITKEADFFLGLLYRFCDRPGITREALGLPDGSCRALLLPRLLIGCFPADLNILALEYGLFWIKGHQEHAEALGLYTRPRMQTELNESFAIYENEFGALYNEGTALIGATAGTRALAPAWAGWLARAVALTVRWREFLAALHRDLLACQVPTGQINIYPLIVDHMRREADYTLDALNRILTAAGVGC